MSNKGENEKGNNKIHWMVWHGALGKENWKEPKCVAKTKKVNRKDQGNKTNASEYIDQPDVLGSVIVNLQMTPVDIPGYISIRVWAKIDDAMALLMKHLGLEMKKKRVEEIEGNRVICPYNKKGQFDSSKRMILDLNKGQKIRICHPKAKNKVKVGRVTNYDPFGHYLIAFDRIRRFGKWWLPLARDGKIQQLPLMNENPKFVEAEEEGEKED